MHKDLKSEDLKQYTKKKVFGLTRKVTMFLGKAKPDKVVGNALRTLAKNPWRGNTKASEECLKPLCKLILRASWPPKF